MGNNAIAARNCTTEFRHFALLLALVTVLPRTSAIADDEAPAAKNIVTVEFDIGNGPQTESGRILATTERGSILLETRFGRRMNITSDQIVSQVDTEDVFEPADADELGQHLIELTSPAFAIHRTDHYVICSDAEGPFLVWCERLLERVHQQYFRFWQDEDFIKPPTHPLPIIIFRRTADFQTFANRQHPGTSFEGIPGYYSIPHNMVLLTDLTEGETVRTSRDLARLMSRKPEQAINVVHESVHQLAFNSGLSQRFADNPLWLTEGFALYFEASSGRSITNWASPGGVNQLHATRFKARADAFDAAALEALIASDGRFVDPDDVANAYAESWALTWHLLHTRRKDYVAFSQDVAANPLLINASPAQRKDAFANHFGGEYTSLTQQVRTTIARRVRE